MTMKSFLITLIPLVSLSIAQEPGAVAEPEPEPKEKKKPQYVLDLESLTPEENKAYGQSFFRADRLFKENRIFECLEELEKVHEIYDGNPSSLNLQGACYVEFRAFEKARNAFAKADAVSPGNINVQFNIAEVDFVSKNYAEALKQFEALLKRSESEKVATNMLPILKFKVLLCRLMAKDVDGAAKIIEDRSFLDDTPLFYYGKAALAYQQDDGATAEKWLARAGRIFRDQKLLAPWQDTLIEFGYIKSFYGGDLEVENGNIPDVGEGE